MKKLILIVLLIVTACTQAPPDTNETLTIVTSFSILQDMVENITHDKAQVSSLVPIGVDPHSYEPLPSDATNVANADLVFYNGFNLESGKGWFQNLLVATNQTGNAFAVTEFVTPIHLVASGSETDIDPHAWLDVNNAILYVEFMTEKIIEKDPDHKDFYTKNSETYIQELKDLHNTVLDQAHSIPETDRFLVTSEGAFKYFAQAYDFTAAYIWEINTDNQGTPQQMNDLIRIIRDNNVRALFIETSVNPQSMEAISLETGVPIHARIFTDSLAQKGNDGDTYISMMLWNIEHITDGLTH